MSVETILEELRMQRNHLDAAILALAGTAVTPTDGRGKYKRGTMSAAARRRIGEATRLRWKMRKAAGLAALGNKSKPGRKARSAAA
jgi:hypothetical protein